MQHGGVEEFDPRAWSRADPDPDHRRELRSWAAGRPPPDASIPLRFGTAGLRGAMGPGPGRMNRVVVRITTRALGAELISTRLAERGVVVGHDARPNSDAYAADTARALRGLGIPCILVDGPVPTPVVASLALHQAAGAAVMITASHNPRGDNGYKVYWSDGAQIRSPIDRRIEDRMDFVNLPSEDDLAPRESLDLMTPRAAIAEYLGTAITTRLSGTASPTVVYTPLCGVGAETVELAFAAAGLAPPIPVPEQYRPDGAFPDLPFPNPEEPGALDRAMATADAAGVDVVLANDPDADRLGVAVREGQGWWLLTGDEIGTLLCDRRIRTTSGPDRVVASSVVSGGAVPALCSARGVRHVSTLTGFKWIMRPAIDEPDATWVFGYEEALGFSVTDQVRDKDGISAAVEFMMLLAELDAAGSSPRRRLREIAAEVGLFATSQVSVRGEPASLQRVLAELRADPPSLVGRAPVATVEDWLTKPDPLGTDLLVLHLEGGGGIANRPTGNEPNNKL